MRDTCFLLGAGASVDAGFPTMARLRTDFLRADRDALLSARLHESVALADKDFPQHIEGLLSFLNATAKNNDSPKERRDAAILAFEIKKFILRHVSKRPSTVAYLDGLRDFLTPKPLDIFSLNYDVVIETWCDQRGLTYTDGFNQHDEWDHQFLIHDRYDVRLWKLHGSITWKEHNDHVAHTGRLGTLREELRTGELRSRTFDASIIYPAAPKTATGILDWLQASFAARLANLELLITIGYSFGDEHISTTMAQALDQNPALHLLICDPSPATPMENLQCHTDPAHHGRIHAQPGTGGSILQPGTLTGMIASLPSAIAPGSRRPWAPPAYKEPDRPPARMTVAPQPIGTLILSQACGSIAEAEDTLLYLARAGETWTLYELPWPLPGNAMPRAVCTGFYDPRGITIRGQAAYVVDAKILGRYMGAGGIWHVNLKSGDKIVLVGRPRPGGLWSVLRSRDRDVLAIGVLRWPTSITTHNETLLVTESRRLVTINTTNGNIRPVGGKSFLNLNGVAHWRDAECLVFEHALATARAPGPGVGTLWSIDLDDRRPPRCITGGFTNARGLRWNHDRTTAYIGEVQENGTWHIVRVDLKSGQREPLPGTYRGKPGFNDHTKRRTPRGHTRRHPKARPLRG